MRGSEPAMTHPALVLMAAFDKATAEGRSFNGEWNCNGKLKMWTGKLPKRRQARCGAVCRTGEPCKRRVVQGKRRCRIHGGLSTGPKTAEGRERIAEANRKRAESRKRNREERIRRGEIALAEIERRQRERLPLAS